MRPAISNFTHYTDQQLLALIQKGKGEAFNALYRRYYLQLCRKAYTRIPSIPRVEELVQDVFMNFWLKAAGLDSSGNIRAYLYATLRNKILHELRTEANRKHYLSKIGTFRGGATERSFLEEIYAQETEHRIAQLLKTLPAQCKEAFCLSRYEKLSYKEIAERMQLSINTVEKHIGKALRILREKLSQFEDALPALLLLILLFL